MLYRQNDCVRRLISRELKQVLTYLLICKHQQVVTMIFRNHRRIKGCIDHVLFHIHVSINSSLLSIIYLLSNLNSQQAIQVHNFCLHYIYQLQSIILIQPKLFFQLKSNSKLTTPLTLLIKLKILNQCQQNYLIDSNSKIILKLIILLHDSVIRCDKNPQKYPKVPLNLFDLGREKDKFQSFRERRLVGKMRLEFVQSSNQ